jgi:hypothetical protein
LTELLAVPGELEGFIDEDAYWAEKALRAEADGSVGSEKSMAFLSRKTCLGLI